MNQLVKTNWLKVTWVVFVFWILVVIALHFFGGEVLAAGRGVSLPSGGDGDAASKLEVAGTMLRLLDTVLFQWGSRLFAGLCVLSAGWAIKEQRVGVAIICFIGALIFGTSAVWVKNIFAIGGSDSIFEHN